MHSDQFAFGMLWATLALGPLLALGVFYLISVRSIRAARWVALGAALVLGGLLLGALAQVSFVWRIADLAAICVGYVAYSLLVGAADFVRRANLRRTLKVLGWLVFFLGWFASTAGALALELIARDYALTPLTETFDGDLTCEQTLWGGVRIARGYSVDLYREWRPLPLRRRLVSIPVNESDPSSNPRSATCADALIQAGRS